VENFYKYGHICQIEYDFQKSRVTGPWDHTNLVPAKRRKNIFHASYTDTRFYEVFLPIQPSATSLLVLYTYKILWLIRHEVCFPIGFERFLQPPALASYWL
jgi:hypothetical protein